VRRTRNVYSPKCLEGAFSDVHLQHPVEVVSMGPGWMPFLRSEIRRTPLGSTFASLAYYQLAYCLSATVILGIGRSCSTRRETHPRLLV
jgi:hypothetical protein